MSFSFRPAPVLGALALAAGTAAVVLSVTDVTVGDDRARITATPQPGAVLRLGANGRFSPDAFATVRSARTTDRIGRLTPGTALPRCPSATVDLGTWCLDRTVRGTADLATASRRCVKAGGFLPTAAQLTGAASRVRLSGRLDDRGGGALLDPAGRRDLRELSATTITTTTGSRAAGAFEAPFPPTLQAVTVFDNRDAGGFAGAIPVAAPERFRCAFFERQGRAAAAPRVAATRVRVAARSTVRITARVPGAGALAAEASVRTGSRTVALGRTRTVVRRTRAGSATVVIRPSAAGRRALRAAGSSRITVELRFRTTRGVLATATTRARVSRP